jgi:transcriptional/translational regulatory protein YebC/TACO1
VVEKAYVPDEDAMMEVAIDAGAEDLQDSESSWDIVTEPGGFQAVQRAVEQAGIPVVSAEISMIPTASVAVGGSEARQVLQLIEALEDIDDVQNVYANFDIPEEVMASL